MVPWGRFQRILTAAVLDADPALTHSRWGKRQPHPGKSSLIALLCASTTHNSEIAGVPGPPKNRARSPPAQSKAAGSTWMFDSLVAEPLGGLGQYAVAAAAVVAEGAGRSGAGLAGPQGAKTRRGEVMSRSIPVRWRRMNRGGPPGQTSPATWPGIADRVALAAWLALDFSRTPGFATQLLSRHR